MKQGGHGVHNRDGELSLIWRVPASGDRPGALAVFNVKAMTISKENEVSAPLNLTSGPPSF
jgi:hypothetical protein